MKKFLFSMLLLVFVFEISYSQDYHFLKNEVMQRNVPITKVLLLTDSLIEKSADIFVYNFEQKLKQEFANRGIENMHFKSGVTLYDSSAIWQSFKPKTILRLVTDKTFYVTKYSGFTQSTKLLLQFRLELTDSKNPDEYILLSVYKFGVAFDSFEKQGIVDKIVSDIIKFYVKQKYIPKK
ncbi:MAG: hypothetical protein LBN23_06080 [Paludibacter sp.]|jgi:hypothetical protein|nr:hypothetical protein [Paludibacter sp.]